MNIQKVSFADGPSLWKVFFVSMLITNSVVVFPVNARIYHVTSVSEFRDALNEARSNNQDDIVFVDKGEYLLDSFLAYTSSYREDNYSLLIGGLPWQKPILNGRNITSILNIDTNLSPRGENANIVVSDLIFQNGRYRGGTGGAFPGGLKISTFNANIKVVSSAFLGNYAAELSWGGGAAYLRSQDGNISFFNNIISGNEGVGNQSVGGVKIDATRAVNFFNNTITENVGWAGGAYLLWRSNRFGSENSRINIVNNIFHLNTGNSQENRTGMYAVADIRADDCPFFTIERNNSEGNSSLVLPDSFGRPLSSCYHPYSISGRVAGDPLLTSEFRLESRSPCIDAGRHFSRFVSRFPPRDYLGNKRTVDGNSDGVIAPDIGAIEFFPSGGGNGSEPDDRGGRPDPEDGEKRVKILPVRPIGGIPKFINLLYLPIEDLVDNSNDLVGWNLSTRRTYQNNSLYSLHYGNRKTPGNELGKLSSRVSATIREVEIPKDKKLFLSFFVYLDAAQKFRTDKLRVLVAGKEEWRNTDNNIVGDWERIEINLSHFQGQTVDIAFEVDAVALGKNTSEGIYIDNIVMSRESKSDKFIIAF